MNAEQLKRACAAGKIGESCLGLVVFPDGSMEATIWAERYVRENRARFATPTEIESYERQFSEDDANARD